MAQVLGGVLPPTWDSRWSFGFQHQLLWAFGKDNQRMNELSFSVFQMKKQERNEGEREEEGEGKWETEKKGKTKEPKCYFWKTQMLCN